VVEIGGMRWLLLLLLTDGGGRWLKFELAKLVDAGNGVVGVVFARY